jgi:hypothetical protein
MPPAYPLVPERPPDAGTPLILYIPGLLPKPPVNLHRDALRRCLLAGIGRADPEVARAVRATPQSFDVVEWTYDFYGEHRDIARDLPAVDAVIARPSASLADLREATSWRRRLTLWLYRTGDLLPFLIPHLANEHMELHLRDLNRYATDEDGAATRAREQTKLALKAAHESARPILFIGHSMGSVIGYDTLWELTHVDDETLPIDLWLTMGSPLGQRYLKRRLLGYDRAGAGRYPGGIRRWVNLTAVGDMTAIDPVLADDYAEMRELGLVEAIVDRELYGHYRLDGQLNVHAEYGYLANVVTGKVIADWWRGLSERP